MKEFTLRKYSFGPLGIVGDSNHPVLAEAKKRLDVDEAMPRLIEACAIVPGDTVIDVGAFIGDTAYPLANAGASVLAFEPFLDAYTAMLYNTHGLNVKAMNAPVGNGEWVQYVYECPGPNFGMRRVIPVPEGTAGAVKTFRLNDLMGPHDHWKAKLIKIDCEGSEIPTLQGASKLITRDRPFLFIEHYLDGMAQRGYTAQQLVDTIKGYGYEMEMWGQPPRWDWFCWPKTS